MSIRIAASPDLIRETRRFLVRALGFAIAAIPVPVLAGMVGALSALSGLVLFAALLVVIDRAVGAHHPYPRLGTANRITLARAAIACVIAVRVIEPAPLDTPERWLVVAIAGAALLLDGVDGWAARRQRLVSSFGARFDLEADAFAILVLAVTAIKAGAVPCWVLLIGAMRYLYLAAGLVLPLLRRPCPVHPVADRRRKTIAVIQSLALLTALIPALPRGLAAAGCAAALFLLVYSFAADFVLLTRRRMGEVE